MKLTIVGYFKEVIKSKSYTKVNLKILQHENIKCKKILTKTSGLIRKKRYNEGLSYLLHLVTLKILFVNVPFKSCFSSV